MRFALLVLFAIAASVLAEQENEKKAEEATANKKDLRFRLKDKRGAPDTTYGAPTQSYGAPSPSYAASSPSYAAPPQSFGAPLQSYGAHHQSFGAPSQSYGAPHQSFGAPSQSYGAPLPSYAPPPTSYESPPPPSLNQPPVQVFNSQPSATYGPPPGQAYGPPLTSPVPGPAYSTLSVPAPSVSYDPQALISGSGPSVDYNHILFGAGQLSLGGYPGLSGLEFSHGLGYSLEPQQVLLVPGIGSNSLGYGRGQLVSPLFLRGQDLSYAASPHVALSVPAYASQIPEDARLKLGPVTFGPDHARPQPNGVSAFAKTNSLGTIAYAAPAASPVYAPLQTTNAFKISSSAIPFGASDTTYAAPAVTFTKPPSTSYGTPTKYVPSPYNSISSLSPPSSPSSTYGPPGYAGSNTLSSSTGSSFSGSSTYTQPSTTYGAPNSYNTIAYSKGYNP